MRKPVCFPICGQRFIANFKIVSEEEAPSGKLGAFRGSYSARSRFTDDDKKTHLEFNWAFDIKKDWE